MSLCLADLGASRRPVYNLCTDWPAYTHLDSWWLGLRALLRMRDTVTIEAMDRRFDCPDLASKTAALAKATRWVHFDLRRVQMLAPTFAAAGNHM